MQYQINSKRKRYRTNGKLNYSCDDTEVLVKHNGLAQICDFHVPRDTICFPYIFLNKFRQFSWHCGEHESWKWFQEV